MLKFVDKDNNPIDLLEFLKKYEQYDDLFDTILGKRKSVQPLKPRLLHRKPSKKLEPLPPPPIERNEIDDSLKNTINNYIDEMNNNNNVNVNTKNSKTNRSKSNLNTISSNNQTISMETYNTNETQTSRNRTTKKSVEPKSVQTSSMMSRRIQQNTQNNAQLPSAMRHVINSLPKQKPVVPNAPKISDGPQETIVKRGPEFNPSLMDFTYRINKKSNVKQTSTQQSKPNQMNQKVEQNASNQRKEIVEINVDEINQTNEKQQRNEPGEIICLDNSNEVENQPTQVMNNQDNQQEQNASTDKQFEFSKEYLIKRFFDSQK